VSTWTRQHWKQVKGKQPVPSQRGHAARTAEVVSIICEVVNSHGEEKEESEVDAGARSECPRVLISVETEEEKASECGYPDDRKD